MHAYGAALAALLLTAGCTAQPAAEPGPAQVLEWEVVRALPHDATSFTQGLELLDSGHLAESSGLYGSSRLSVVSLEGGEPLMSVDLPDDHFAEGLTRVGDHLLQLTWKEGVVHLWRLQDLAPVGSFSVEGQGWGLCYDEERDVVWRSDGTSQLAAHEPSTFEPLSAVSVRLDGEPVELLNELECVDGHVWANVWKSATVVRIDPDDGVVGAVTDFGALVEQAEEAHGRPFTPDEVLNGLAYNRKAGTWFVTGKQWPVLYEIRIIEP